MCAVSGTACSIINNMKRAKSSQATWTHRTAPISVSLALSHQTASLSPVSTTSRVDATCWRPVNSGSGNRALRYETTDRELVQLTSDVWTRLVSATWTIHVWSSCHILDVTGGCDTCPPLQAIHYHYYSRCEVGQCRGCQVDWYMMRFKQHLQLHSLSPVRCTCFPLTCIQCK